ncbi:MAG: AIR synthase-related protein, partial [Candidatus Deferrimicrobiaceae bacterium]
LEGSGLSAEIRLRDIPVFPGVRDLMRCRTVAALSARRAFPGASFLHSRFGSPPVPGGAHENISFQIAKVRVPPLLPREEILLLADPQTSGGLLLFVPEERAEALLQALAREGEGAWTIGRTLAMPAPEMHRVTVV